MNDSTSAAARTPVYLAITASAARGHLVQVALHPGPDVRAVLHEIRGRVDRAECGPTAVEDVGDVPLVYGDVLAGAEPAEVAADVVASRVGQGPFRGVDVAGDGLAEVEVVDGHPAGIGDVDEHQ